MRLVVFSLALALTASAPLAAEVQAPVSTQPLAAGEVLLEVNALGSVGTRADRATMSVSVSGSGETEAEARTAAQNGIRDLRAALRRLGIAEADMTVGPVSASTSVAMIDVPAAEPDPTQNIIDTNMAESPASSSAQAQLEIVIRNIDRVPAVQEALQERSLFAPPPVYVVNDDSGARRQARAQALAKARADAEAYAAPLNMRVVRVVRVTERLGLDMMSLIASEMQSLTRLFASPDMRNNGPEVQTLVVVGVDFALAPR